MKRIIILLSVAGIISLGFTVVGSTTNTKEESVRTEQKSTTNYSGLSDQNDKRLASWD